MSIYGKLVNRQGEPVDQGNRFYKTPSGRYAETQTPLVNSKGEYNASNKADLIKALASLVDMAAAGDIHREATVDPAANARFVQAALADKNSRGGPFERLGQVMAEMISETMGRQGFTDKLLARQSWTDGGTPRVEIDQMDVVAWQMVANGHVAESVASPKFIYPEGFWLNCLLLVEDQDLAFAGSSFLERKFQTALQAIMVREDNVFKFLADQASTVSNDLVSFSAFTPTVFGSLRNQIWRWSLNATACLLAVDLQQDILADTDWHGVYSPVEQHILFEEGKFGEIYGVEVITDGFREDNLRVLNEGEVYLLGAPGTLGTKLPIKDLESNPVDQYAFGRPVRGWSIRQFEALVIANSRAVSRGVKI